MANCNAAIASNSFLTLYCRWRRKKKETEKNLNCNTSFWRKAPFHQMTRSVKRLVLLFIASRTSSALLHLNSLRFLHLSSHLVRSFGHHLPVYIYNKLHLPQIVLCMSQAVSYWADKKEFKRESKKEKKTRRSRGCAEGQHCSLSRVIFASWQFDHTDVWAAAGCSRGHAGFT